MNITTRKKISAALKGRKFSEERKNNIRFGLLKSAKFWEARKVAAKKLRGRKFTKSHRKNLSLAKKGKSTWSKGKKLHYRPTMAFTSERTTGQNNVNWKGGVTPENAKIRHSKRYVVWRTKVFERDNYTCQLCGKRGGGELNADHIKSFAVYPHLRFALKNGRTLCVACHRQTQNYGRKRN